MRGEGADSCPDQETLREHVQRLRGHPTTGAPSDYRVSFSYQAGVFRADIQVGAGSGTRVLEDRGPTCVSLEQATALTLALLLDSDANEPPAESSRPAPVPPPPPARQTAPARSRREASRQSRATRLAVSLGGGALVGSLQPVAPAVLGDIGIGVSRFRTGIGVLWVPPQTRDFGPGELRQSLLSGVARTCLTALDGPELRFDVCSGVHAGRLKVRALDYTRNGSADKVWLAVPVGLSLSTTSSSLAFELAASALVPLRRDDFSIDGLGVAYESWPVGMLLSLSARGAWRL